MIPNPVIALSVFAGFILLAVAIFKLRVTKWIVQNPAMEKKTLIEDILKQLYHVEYGGRIANLSSLAGALKVSDKTLLKVVEEMSVKSLIKVENQRLKLTSSGNDYALKIIRVHRLWEKYLSEKTGIDKSEWHDRAERKEHKLTTAQAEQLYAELGNPRFDPHGDPIPTLDGEIMEPHWKPLSMMEQNTLGRIVHIEDEPAVIYQQILDNKLHIGSQVKVVSSDDHEIRFLSEGEDYTLSTIVASNISVEDLNSHELYEEGKIRLTSLQPGEKARILGISFECRGANRRRLLDLGFTKGTIIEAEFESPMSEPKAYSVRNTIIALRNAQSEMILIEKEK